MYGEELEPDLGANRSVKCAVMMKNGKEKKREETLARSIGWMTNDAVMAATPEHANGLK